MYFAINTLISEASGMLTIIMPEASYFIAISDAFCYNKLVFYYFMLGGLSAG